MSSTNIPLHPTTPHRKFNAFNENGLPIRDSLPAHLSK